MPTPKIIIDNEKTFKEIYLKNLRNVEYFANSYLRDMEMARSVAHDSFLKLWEKRHEIDYNQEVLAYLFVVTRNKCLNILKQEKSRNKFSDYIAYKENLLNQAAITHSTSTSLYEKEVKALTDAALNSMPPKVKETFMLSRVIGLKNKEIAAKQSISVSAVEYRLASAYRILRKRLKDYLPIIL